ncbi:Pycsar system effector family protein [Sinosporangium siamense]|nr:Pycsar system effector family protein [Sinosporangium siamense]
MNRESPPSAFNVALVDHGATDAWKALLLIFDLVKHAETKAGLTLAASGASGGVVYALISGMGRENIVFQAAAWLCACLVIAAACSAGLALLPRRRTNPEPVNLLYYHHIARHYSGRSDVYARELAALMKNSDDLVAAIAQQVWSNAHVAHQKYRWAGHGLNALLAALAALAVAAAVAVL